MPFGPDWLIPVLLIVLFFGARKLPELARAVGESLGEFRKATKDMGGDTHAAETGAEDERRRDVGREA